jgi:glycosyltransferase involved in cell wall biosynthesis
MIDFHLGLQQRVLPAYRGPFFEALGAAYPRRLHLFSGRPMPREGVIPIETLQNAAITLGENKTWFTPGSPLFLCWQPDFYRWLYATEPQVLIAEANPRYRSTPPAIRWMKARRRKVIGWGLGAPAAKGVRGWLRRLGWPAFLHQFDALIAYSQRGADQYRACGVTPERIFVAFNATAPRPTQPPPQRSAAFAGAPTVLFVGRLQARKRVDILLQACASLPDAIQPRLVIVGDGNELGPLRSLAQRIYPRAEFAGERSGQALAPFWTAADLFVLPGTGGLAVQEAMSHALPVIVARGDGTQDDLVRPQNGWQIPPDDPAALREALLQALSDAPRLRLFGAESYRIVREEVNIETMVQVFQQALAWVAGGRQ